MKRFTFIVFFLFSVSLIGFLVYKTFAKDSSSETVRAKVVIPVTTNKTEQTDSTESYSSVEVENTSLVQLNFDETLITTLSVDVNSDSYEDQVIAMLMHNTLESALNSLEEK